MLPKLRTIGSCQEIECQEIELAQRWEHALSS